MLGSDVDWVAALVAAVVAFALGALWYSPLLFARPWMRYTGWDAKSPDEIQQLQRTAGPAYAVSFLSWFVMAVVLSVVCDWADAATWVDGAGVAALLWLGFVATTGLTAQVFHSRPLGLFLVDGGYQLVFMMLMGAIVAGWPW
jgi:hypothetical protein